MKSHLTPTTHLIYTIGLILFLSACFASEALAQRATKQQENTPTAVTLQAVPVKAKQMPANTSFANICSKAQKTTRQKANVFTVACKPSSPAAPSRLVAKSGAQRSDINCKYTENDDGGLEAESCTCKADEKSNCTNFITWCAKGDGDVGGNNQNATCSGGG